MSSTPKTPYSDDLGRTGGSDTATATAAAAAAAAGTGRSGSRRRRGALVIALVLVLVVVGLAAHGAKGYYELSPGDAPLVTASSSCEQKPGAANLTLPGGGPCARLEVSGATVATTDGHLYMVDVLEGPASPLDYALSKLGLLGSLRSGHELVPAAAILGTTPASQLGCQDAQQMTDATQTAAVAALSRLGYDVGADPVGARVVQVNPASAAAAAGLECNDLITAVGATTIHSAADLSAAIHAERPGRPLTIVVQRTSSTGASRRVTITATPTGVPAMPASAGAPARPAQPGTAFLGVATSDDVTYRLPFHVSIDVGDIGGPSAGLALTLGLLDVLSQGHLTGGHSVAATGTIAPDGTVGDVGGVAQKTVAVHRAGAQLFLVPVVELATARQHADGMEVEAVGSLSQAVADLVAIGGAISPPNHTAPSAA